VVCILKKAFFEKRCVPGLNEDSRSLQGTQDEVAETVTARRNLFQPRPPGKRNLRACIYPIILPGMPNYLLDPISTTL